MPRGKWTAISRRGMMLGFHVTDISAKRSNRLGEHSVTGAQWSMRWVRNEKVSLYDLHRQLADVKTHFRARRRLCRITLSVGVGVRTAFLIATPLSWTAREKKRNWLTLVATEGTAAKKSMDSKSIFHLVLILKRLTVCDVASATLLISPLLTMRGLTDLEM